MSEAAGDIRHRLQPYYGTYKLPDMFVDRLVQTLRQRGLAGSLESFLAATESLLARLLEACGNQGVDGLPLRVGPFALLHLVQPPAEFLAENGDFCFCIGIQLFGSLSLKFFANAKVHSSTVSKGDYAKLLSREFYQALLKKVGDCANQLFTKVVLFDLEKCIYVYKSLDDVIGESTFPARGRAASIPSSVFRPSYKRMGSLDTAETNDHGTSRSRASSVGGALCKQREEDREYRLKNVDLCDRLSRLLCDELTERKNWRHLAANLMEWDFAKCTTFEERNEKASARRMLGKFIELEQTHQLHSQKWIYHRIVEGLRTIGRQDLFGDLSITSPPSTPTEENTAQLSGLNGSKEPSVAQTCTDRNSNDDVLIADGSSAQPINLFQTDIHLLRSSQPPFPTEEDEPGSKQDALMRSRVVNLKDVSQRLVTSFDEGHWQGKPIPIDHFKEYKQMHPPDQHCPPNTATQPFPGKRSNNSERLPTDTAMRVEGLSLSPAGSLEEGSGYAEPGDAVQAAAMHACQDSLAEEGDDNTPYASICSAVQALSLEAQGQAGHTSTGPGYPSPTKVVQAALK